jgi:hypothetical protein
MKREEVFDLVDSEREYQNSLAHHSKEIDESTSVAAWLMYMERLIADAKERVYQLDEEGALEHVRKATAVGVACMEHNDTKPRT